MEPLKIAGLTLKSEVKGDEGYDPDNENTQPELQRQESNLYKDQVKETDRMGVDNSIPDQIKRLIQLVGGLPSTDATIRAIAKLKGALELLNS